VRTGAGPSGRLADHHQMLPLALEPVLPLSACTLRRDAGRASIYPVSGMQGSELPDTVGVQGVVDFERGSMSPLSEDVLSSLLGIDRPPSNQTQRPSSGPPTNKRAKNLSRSPRRLGHKSAARVFFDFYILVDEMFQILLCIRYTLPSAAGGRNF